MTADSLWRAFRDEYLPVNAESEDLDRWGRFELLGTKTVSAPGGGEAIAADLRDGAKRLTIEGQGNGPIDAFVNAVRQHCALDVSVLDYSEHALSTGGDATAAAYLECEVEGQVLWGVGIDPSITTASLKAIVSALNRAVR
jgi:2-isopropylmalate synthase